MYKKNITIVLHFICNWDLDVWNIFQKFYNISELSTYVAKFFQNQTFYKKA